jgi:hypothetical protein
MKIKINPGGTMRPIELDVDDFDTIYNVKDLLHRKVGQWSWKEACNFLYQYF